MDISIVIPTYNRSKILRRSLETIFAQDFPSSEFEVIVVVDGSKDNTAEALKPLRPACRFRVIEQENRGLAGARNTGFRAAESDLVLFLDDDMRSDPGLVAAHVKAHRRYGDVVVFGSLFLSSDSTTNLASECFRREIGAFHLLHAENPSVEWKITDCIFSNSSISREMMAEVGGFDERFRMREDLDLGIRLMERGVRMKYANDAIAYEYYDKTAADLLADARAFGVADALLARKHPEQMIEGHLRWLENDPALKKTLRGWGARWPVLEKCLLAPWCYLGDEFFRFPPFRSIGIRALQMRRRIHWLRAVQQSTLS